MNPSSFFCHLSTKGLARMMEEARELVCYSAPGIEREPAEALVRLSQRLAPEKLIVCIDCDERVLRMGYGDLEAVKLLREAGIEVNHFPKLRSAMCIVDEEGYSFTPTARYLEAELGVESCNAIRLSPGQVSEALKEFHEFMRSKTATVSGNIPPQEVILIAGSELEEALPVPEAPSSEATVSLTAVDERQLGKIAHSFQMAPPVQFDLARQVRVYESYIQYVELKLTGASFQRQRISIPDSLQQLGKGKDLDGRLKTTFALIEKESNLSSHELEKELVEIRKIFTRSLGKYEGSVLLKCWKRDIEERLDALREKLKNHKEAVKKGLEESIGKAVDQVSEYYLPIVKADTPDKLKGGFLKGDISDEGMLNWIKSEVKKKCPNVKQIVDSMRLEVHYKDITYETLKNPEFIKKIRKEFPLIDWDSLHKEYMAAGEHSSEQIKNV